MECAMYSICYHQGKPKASAYIVGGGSTEASFSGAPHDSINYKIWSTQLSKDAKFRVKSSQLFRSLMAEAENSAILTTLSVVRNQIAENPEFGCDVVVETAKVSVVELLLCDLLFGP